MPPLTTETPDILPQSNAESAERPSGKVLVLGTDTRSFLSVVRSLGRRNLEVHVAWHSPGSPALSSRYVNEIHTLPLPWKKDGDWKTELISLLQSKQFDLVIPCNDPCLVPLQESRGEIECHCRVALINDRAYQIAFNKRESALLADTLGIPTAESMIIANIEDLATAEERLGLPLILKPERSYSVSRLDRRNQVTRVDSQQDARKHAERMLENNSVLAEQYFTGVGVGVEFIADRGQLITVFQHQRVHEPESGGGSSLRKSVPVAPDLRDATEKIVRELTYTGVGMIEFRFNLSTGRWIFIEINGRFWGSLPLAIACGMDFPSYLYDLHVLRSHSENKDYKNGRRNRNLRKDLSWYREQVAGSLRSVKRLPRLCCSLLDDLFHCFLLRNRSDTLVLDDPKPGMVEIFQLIGELQQRLRRKVVFKLRSLAISQSMQYRRLLRSLRGAKRVLFVCKGNICRSPFAERYSQRECSKLGVEVSSSGYFPRNGRPSPSTAIKVAEEFDIALHDHRSNVICDADVRTADVIIVFDDENRRVLRGSFPDARSRIHMLGCVKSNKGLAIDDPYSGTASRFRETYLTIQAAIDELVTALKQSKP